MTFPKQDEKQKIPTSHTRLAEYLNLCPIIMKSSIDFCVSRHLNIDIKSFSELVTVLTE